MRKINIVRAFLFVIYNSTAQNHKSNVSSTGNVISFGAKIDMNEAISVSEMSEKYHKMTSKDTVQTKFVAKVTEVCKVKGCWMKLEMKDGQETMVRFKDYGFFMPNDIAGKEVVVNGLAFVEEMSVEDQKHYAKDGGEPEEAINKITAPKKTYSFEADGVLIKQ